MDYINEFAVLSHNDLDGYACSILAKLVLYFNPSLPICKYQNGDDLNKNVGYSSLSKSLREYVDYLYGRRQDPKIKNTILFVTDLNISEADVNYIIEKKSTGISRGSNNIKTVICDHHESSRFLMSRTIDNNILESRIVLDQFPEKQSGAMIFYNYLIENSLLPENQVIKQFIYYVSMYDTWQWVDKESFAKTLNTYFTLTENNLFVKEMFDLLINNSVTDFRTEFEKNERAMLVVAEREKDIKNTCYRKCNEAKISMFHEYKVASVFCDRYLSDIGNYICQQKPDIDFCMMFTPNGYTISFRSIKDDLNLARMASRLFPQGGGHAKAAGARLTREHFIEMMSNHLL